MDCKIPVPAEVASIKSVTVSLDLVDSSVNCLSRLLFPDSGAPVTIAILHPAENASTNWWIALLSTFGQLENGNDGSPINPVASDIESFEVFSIARPHTWESVPIRVSIARCES